MASVGKVEHAPESSIGIGLGDLEKREVWRVGGRKSEFVDGRDYTSIGNGPFEVARGLATNNAG
jgi:hypothetical protein